MPKADNYHLHVPIVKKSGGLNFLEICWPVQAYKGTALPFIFYNLKTAVIRTLGHHVVKEIFDNDYT